MSRVSPEVHHGQAQLNLEHRDPLQIHDSQSFKVAWPDIFAEPDPGVHSLSPIWRASFVVFSFVRLWTYRILSIFGVVSACCFGLNYGCTACYTIWCCTPSLKLFRIQCLPCKQILTIFLDTCYRPCVDVISYLFWNFRVVIAKDDHNPQTV